MSYNARESAPPTAESAQLVTADHYMPFAIEKVQARKDALNKIINNLLVPGVDFGEQPGSASHQKVLKKSGAEKLCSSFGLAPRIVEEVKTLDWTGAEHGGEPFFAFEYRIALYRGDLFLGEATASCNSWEKKYRYQWVSESEVSERTDLAKLPRRGGKKILFEPDFALDKRETTGKYGKPLEYWHRFDEARRESSAVRMQKQLGKKTYLGYQIEVDDAQVRVPNPSAPDCVNTVQKMAYKRALVAAVVVVTNCSDAFTQDLDDEEEGVPSAPPPEPDPRETVQPPPQGAPPAPRERMERSTRAIPEEMRDLVSRLRREPKFISEAYAIMAQHFARRGVEAGQAYEAMNQEFRGRYPKGSPGMSDVENHITQLLDLYDKLQTFPEPVQA